MNHTSTWQERQAIEREAEKRQRLIIEHEMKGLRNKVRKAFSRDTMKKVCEMHEYDFDDAYDLELHVDPKRTRNNFYYYQDNGSNILAVAHLDTVVWHTERRTTFCETINGPVCHSGALDDRLGAYIILHLLPALGLKFDILLTVGEEQGQSTAELFEPPEGKDYNWIIEFDRKQNDVVMYEYESPEMKTLVKDCGAKVGYGSVSDISYLNHMGVKAFNWGTGYDGVYHSTKGYVYLMDTYEMVAYFLKFHADNHDLKFDHTRKSWTRGKTGGKYGEAPKGQTYGHYPQGGYRGSSGSGRGAGTGGKPPSNSKPSGSSTGTGGSHTPHSRKYEGGKHYIWVLGHGWAQCTVSGIIVDPAVLQEAQTEDHMVWNDEHGWVDFDPDFDDRDADSDLVYRASYKPGVAQRYVQGYGWIDLDDKGNPVPQAMKSVVRDLDEWSTRPVTIGGVEWGSYMEWWNYTHPEDQVDAAGEPLPDRDAPPSASKEIEVAQQGSLFSHGRR